MIFQKHFFSKQQRNKIIEAIAVAEKKTSGEIRVHVEANCNKEVLERATEIFYQLGMNKTKDANGVLIYIAHEHRKFAIIGDSGINRVVPANFWDGTKEVMREHFKRGEFLEGIVFAVEETGSHLKQYFPHNGDDTNELSNEISEG